MKESAGWRERWKLELATASRRIRAIAMIDPGFEARPSWTVDRYRAVLAEAMSAESNYQAAWAQVEQARRRCQDALDRLAEGSERILDGVARKYSHRSNEYAVVRGTSRPDRRDKGSNGPTTNPTK
jgi:hypothetical protein